MRLVQKIPALGGFSCLGGNTLAGVDVKDGDCKDILASFFEHVVAMSKQHAWPCLR